MTLYRSKAFSIRAVLLTGIMACYGLTNVYGQVDRTGEGINITSEPSGANLYIMGEHAGTTPMTIRERDIYPVSYKANAEKFYGMIVLQRDGCEEYSRRLTRAEIKNGLTARLVCTVSDVVAPSSQLSVTPSVPASTAAVRADVTPVLAQAQQSESQTNQPCLSTRKLKQLKSLLQLLDEGLMSPEEEEKLRRRILDDQ